MISETLLQQHQAKRESYKKGAVIFDEGKIPVNFYQIISGEVKMCNLNEEGREFIQGIFRDGQSFGEPPLFLERVYPAKAVALTDCELFVLAKERFLEMVKTDNEVSMRIIEHLAQRLHYKSVMAAEISYEEPEHRLLKLIDYSVKFFELKKENEGFRIDLTRQQMADLTGLRVETVIRAIKSLEKKNQIKIINRKVFR